MSSSACAARREASISAARLLQRAAADAFVEIIGRLDQRRGRQIARYRQHAVFDRAVLGDEDRQHALGLQPHEVDLLEPRVGFADRHDAGDAGEAGQQAGRLGQHAFEIMVARGGGDLGVDACALVLLDIADLQQRIDEEAQADLGRQPPGADMRRVDEAEFLEILHHIAHRGRR